jgi:hypothetical protein
MAGAAYQQWRHGGDGSSRSGDDGARSIQIYQKLEEVRKALPFSKLLKAFVQLYSLRGGKGIYLLYKGEIFYDGGNAVDIICEYPVFFGEAHELTDIVVCIFQYGAAFERAAEFDGLAGAEQFDGQDVFEVVDYLVGLAAADAAHADVVFLA